LHVPEVVDAIRFGVMTHFGLQLHDVVLLKQGRIAKTSSGKIRRHACRTAYLEGALDVFTSVSKASPSEAKIPAVDVLGGTPA
jgi:hypothetical protein